MKFWEAVKAWQETGVLCRPFGSNDAFKDPCEWGNEYASSSYDWEIETQKITITREELARAWSAHFVIGKGFNDLAKELGFK